MKTLIAFVAIACMSMISASPMAAQSQSLTVNAFVENQVCLSKDFVQVSLSATANSSVQPVGFRWDFTNDGKLDTLLSTDPAATTILPDESAFTSRVVSLNKAGERSSDMISFVTLKCR